MNTTKMWTTILQTEDKKDEKFTQSILEYKDNIEQDDKSTKYVDLFYQFCKQNTDHITLSQVNRDLFYRFFLYYVPRTMKIVSIDTPYQIIHQIGGLCKFVSKETKYNVWKIFNQSLEPIEDNFTRVLHAKREFNLFLGKPVLHIDPLIVDLTFYKIYKYQQDNMEHAPIMEQGYFQILEIFGNHSVILKKKKGKELYIKIILNENLVQTLRTYDIIHMRIKRKLFFTCWDIDDVKSIFLPEANQFLS